MKLKVYITDDCYPCRELINFLKESNYEYVIIKEDKLDEIYPRVDFGFDIIMHGWNRDTFNKLASTYKIIETIINTDDYIQAMFNIIKLNPDIEVNLIKCDGYYKAIFDELIFYILDTEKSKTLINKLNERMKK